MQKNQNLIKPIAQQDWRSGALNSMAVRCNTQKHLLRKFSICLSCVPWQKEQTTTAGHLILAYVCRLRMVN